MTLIRKPEADVREQRSIVIYSPLASSWNDDGTPEVHMKSYNYTVILQPLAEGGFSVLVPAIPEICTFGENVEEARRMAEDAIRCFLESALKTGEPIPQNMEPTLEQVAITVP
jgi:antitoxin HicB